MKTNRQFTAIIEREGAGYVSLCPELDIASQGETVEQARNNLTDPRSESQGNKNRNFDVYRSAVTIKPNNF